MRALVLGLAAALALGGATTAAAAPGKTAAARDWTKVVVATADGGFRVGNPAAERRLVEYGSLTCNHCAHFAAQGLPPLLRDYVADGRLNFEFRNFVRDPFDLTAAMLSRCAGPRDFFALTDRYFATQEQWIARYAALTDAQKAELDALPEADRPMQLARLGGLDSLAAQSGVTQAKAKQCLGDKAGLDRLVAMRQVAVERHKLEGTPTFILDGRTLEAHDWTALRPLLGSPGG